MRRKKLLRVHPVSRAADGEWRDLHAAEEGGEGWIRRGRER